MTLPLPTGLSSSVSPCINSCRRPCYHHPIITRYHHGNSTYGSVWTRWVISVQAKRWGCTVAIPRRSRRSCKRSSLPNQVKCERFGTTAGRSTTLWVAPDWTPRSQSFSHRVRKPERGRTLCDVIQCPLGSGVCLLDVAGRWLCLCLYGEWGVDMLWRLRIRQPTVDWKMRYLCQYGSGVDSTWLSS